MSSANKGDKFIMIPDARGTYLHFLFNLTESMGDDFIFKEVQNVKQSNSGQECPGYSGCGVLGAQIIQWPKSEMF